MSGAFLDAAKSGVTVDSADYVIIGSGAGGGAAARVLADAGYAVVVLEDGPQPVTSELVPYAADSMAHLMRNRGQMAALGEGILPILQARCVGGTTFVNSAIIWRLPESVHAKWCKNHGMADGLPLNALEDAYQTIEKDMSVRQVGPLIQTGSDLMMDRGAKAMGIESRPLFRNEKDCKGSGRCLHGCPNEAKQSTAVNYLRRVVAASGSVFSHARADRIITERGRAVAVDGVITDDLPNRGQKFRVRARRGVVLSGSVFGSPQVLRQSGLGKGNDALGRHFMAHPGMAIGGFYPEAVNMWSGASQGYEAFGLRDSLGVKFESINVPPEVAASRMPGVGASFGKLLDRLPHFGLWSLAVRADAEGTVNRLPILGDHVKYSLTPSDMKRVRSGVAKLAEMHFLGGATEVLLGVNGLPDVLTSPDQLKLIESTEITPKDVSMLCSHLFGTCRAGSDPKTSVVDPMLKVHGVEGLHVMDGSVFPSNTGVNPQHSIMAIATVAARRIAADVLRPAGSASRNEAAPLSAAASL